MGYPVLFTDLDNTLYNWVDYFGMSFRSMVHVISDVTREDEQRITDNFRKIFTDKGSLEYTFSVQELDICKNLSFEQVARLVNSTKRAFDITRKKNLKPYPGVLETLKWANTVGICVFGVTNAPMRLAASRLRLLGLDNLIVGLAAWKGWPIPEDDPIARKIGRKGELGRYGTNIRISWEFSLEELKPNTTPYLKLMQLLSLNPNDVFVIGDSLYKDIEPAMRIGAKGILARYGVECQAKNLDTILKITPWTKDEISKEIRHAEFVPDFYVDSFSQIRTIIEPPQLPLFDRDILDSLLDMQHVLDSTPRNYSRKAVPDGSREYIQSTIFPDELDSTFPDELDSTDQDESTSQNEENTIEFNANKKLIQLYFDHFS